MKDQMIAVEGGHRQDAILELAQVKEEKQEERCTMDEKSKEPEYWRLTAKVRNNCNPLQSIGDVHDVSCHDA